MRQALALTAGFLPLFSGHQSFAQELPVFDDEDFEIVSVEPNSRVIARSDGRDFYCYADVEAAGYVLVWGCLPFVTRGETAEADARYAEAVAAAAKAEAELAAAAKAVAARVAAREKAESDAAAVKAKAAADAAALLNADQAPRTAAEAAIVATIFRADIAKASARKAAEDARIAAEKSKATLEKFASLIGSVDSERAKTTLVSIARKSGCQLAIRNGSITDSMMIQIMTRDSDLFYAFSELVVREELRKRFNEAMVDLEAAGTVEFSDDDSLMRLKDCN